MKTAEETKIDLSIPHDIVSDILTRLPRQIPLPIQRRIGDGPPHFPTDIGVCVDGTIYCKGWTSMANPRVPCGGLINEEDSALIRYDKLFALVDYQRLKDGNSMELCVLEDLHKEVWVKKSIVLPYTWWDIIEDRDFYLAGTIRTDYDLRFGQPFCNISATDHVESILSLSDLNY
ncbi:hypothetical protein L1049_006248 [Liquidambar formosana]|uniref:F-box associated beta-propeller type 3 domain-containing protein n=1 Tax=Liquidambar formosana TaxID=63359 RepID=A0AAP0WQS3_LIQFO